MSDDNVRARGLDSEKWRGWEPVLKRFDRAWQQGSPPVIDDFLPSAGPERGVVLIELVHADLEHRLKADETVRVETYLEQYPELGTDRATVLELIEAEHALRRRRELGLLPEEYYARFPDYHEELTACLPPPKPVAHASVGDERGDTPVEGDLGRTMLDRAPISTTKPHQDAPVIPGYQILDELGRGGMGEVWRAHDPDFNRILAIKVLREKYRGEPDMVSRFLEEAQIVGQLQHPGIVPVHDIGRLEDGRPFFTMKLIKGRTLDELLKERVSLAAELPRFLTIFEHVCQAVAYAHSRDVIHRDLKPLNLMVGAFGEVQVMDWGLAKVLDRDHPSEPPSPTELESTIQTVRTDRPGLSSKAGDVMGTLAYMAPEQARGLVAQVDERSDVFGLGAILCEILTGQPPYLHLGRTPEEIHLQVAQGDLAEAFARLDDCGADMELVGLTKKCLAQERQDRPLNAGVVAEAVAAYQAGVEERLRTAELERKAAQLKAAEERKRRKWIVVAAAAGLLLVSMAGGVTWWYQAQWSARQGATECEVTAALEVANSLNEQGWKQSDDPDRWQVTLQGAFQALERAEGVLNSGAPTNELRAQVGAVRTALEEAQAHCRLAAELDAIRLLLADTKDGRPPFRETADRYAQVFAGLGLDVFGGDLEALARRVNGHRLKERLLAALQDWGAATSGPRRKQLADVVRAGDPDRDGFRSRWREALARQDQTALTALALAPEVKSLPAATLTQLGRDLRTLGAEEPALRLLLAGQERYPADFWLNTELGLTLKGMKPPRPEEAVRFLSVAMALRSGTASAHYMLGLALKDKGDVDAAIRSYRNAIELDPQLAQAHVNLGVTLNDKGSLDEGIRCFCTALELNPKLVQAHYCLGVALRTKGDVDGAIGAYRSAIKLDPKFVDAHYNLGIALRAKGDVEGAIRAYRSVIEFDPKYVSAYNNLGAALDAKGDLEEAARAFRAAAELQPKHARAHNNLGLVLLKQGQFAEAQLAIQRHLELLPVNDPSRTTAAQRIRKCEQMLTLEAKLPNILKGNVKPADAAESLELARLCRQYNKLYAASARLYAGAFAEQPKRAEDQPTQDRYHAACAAALAGCGQGKDADQTNEEERTCLREQALAWLKADLAAWSALLKNNPEKAVPVLQREMQLWQKDPDLAGVRDEKELAKVPEPEREAWRKLWADVDELLKLAREAK